MNKSAVQIFIALVLIQLLTGCSSSAKIAQSRYVIHNKRGLLNTTLNGKCEILGSIVNINTHDPLVPAMVIIDSTSDTSYTNIDGDYSFVNLSPGIYNLKVSYFGFESIHAAQIKLEKNRVMILDFELVDVPIPGQEPTLITISVP